jgi:hypothetical protein
MLRIPHDLDIRLIDSGKVVSPTNRPLSTPQKCYFSASGTHFCQRLSKHRDSVRPEGLGKLKKFILLIGSRTRDHPACNTMWSLLDAYRNFRGNCCQHLYFYTKDVGSMPPRNVDNYLLDHTVTTIWMYIDVEASCLVHLSRTVVQNEPQNFSFRHFITDLRIM